MEPISPAAESTAHLLCEWSCLSVLIPPYSEIEVMTKPEVPLHRETWLVEDRLAQRSQLVIANALVKPPPGKGSYVLRIMNPTLPTTEAIIASSYEGGRKGSCQRCYGH